MTQEQQNLAAIARATMMPPRASLEDQNTAKALCERLRKQIGRATEEATEGEQLAVFYATPAGEEIRVRDISWHNPSLIVLYGTIAGQHSRVLLHQESLALVLQYERSEDPSKKQSIGFSPGEGDKEEPA